MIHDIIKNIGHRFFPYLIEPYRKTRIWFNYWKNIPGQLHDAIQIRNKTFNFKMDEPVCLDTYYKGEDIKPSIPGIIFMVDGKLWHGGLSDRLRGIMTTFKVAQKKKIPFHIFWNYPFSLEDYLEPSGNIDWRIKEEDISFSQNEAYPVVIMETTEPQTHINNYLRLAMALYNPMIQTHVYSNAYNAKGEYAKLYHQLFKPSKKLQLEIDRHISAIGSEYVAFTFRFLNLLGDFVEHSMYSLTNDKKIELIDKIKIEFFSIIKKLPQNYKILITSDSVYFLKQIAIWDSRIYVVPGDVQNIDLVNKKNENAWTKTFVDQQLLMRAKKVYLMRTGRMYKSGFPCLAAEIGGIPFIDHKF